jgi:signal transduction histidine kinase
MAALIENMLDFARGRLGGGLTLDRRPCPVKSILEQVIAEVRSASPDRVVETDIVLDDAYAVPCDSVRIGQLFSNLLANAVTHGQPDTPISVRARIHDGYFELSVANFGAPIPEATLAKLFQPFVRASVRSSQQGLGLGLYIASEVARAHDGTLEVSSTVEETRFTFRMPVR